MELDTTNIDHDHEEEYVLLDLDAVCSRVDIPPDEPYVLSGLDTANPILNIGDKLKLVVLTTKNLRTNPVKLDKALILIFKTSNFSSMPSLNIKETILSLISEPFLDGYIGEYKETIGTCLIFSEKDVPLFHEETGSSETNLFKGACIVDPNHSPSKQVKPVTSLHRILKFRLLLDGEEENQRIEKITDLLGQEEN